MQSRFLFYSLFSILRGVMVVVICAISLFMSACAGGWNFDDMTDEEFENTNGVRFTLKIAFEIAEVKYLFYSLLTKIPNATAFGTFYFFTFPFSLFTKKTHSGFFLDFSSTP